MKILVAVLTCFQVAVVIGSPVDEEGGAPPFCPQVTGQQNMPMYCAISKIGRQCYGNLLTVDESTPLRHNMTTEDVQEYFDTFCHKAVTTRDCLSKQASSVEKNEHPTIQKAFNIFREVLVKTLDSGCDAGAKRFVAFMDGLKSIQPLSSIDKQIQICGKNSFQMVFTIDQSSVDISSRLYVLHKEMRLLQECVSKIQLDQSMRETLDYFTNEIIATMKCVHPQDGALVPCSSIDVDLISKPSICEVMTHEKQLEIYDVLENEAGKCYNHLMRDDVGDIVTVDNETLHDILKEYCSRRRAMGPLCFEEVQLYSDICLNGTKKNEFNLLIRSGKNGIDNACREDGGRLADIMFEVYRLKRSGQGHAVWECIDVAKSTRSVGDEHRSSSKNMRFYHEMEAFKGCLVDKLQGDQASVAAATSLMDELLKNVECAGAEDGTTVTCESLMKHLNDHHHNHENDHDHHHNHHHH